MQHYQLPVLNDEGEVMGYSHHHRDNVIKKDGAPVSLWGNVDWEQVLEETVELRGMEYLKVARVRFRNKTTGEIVSPFHPVNTAQGRRKLTAGIKGDGNLATWCLSRRYVPSLHTANG
jgi:hypothetical protein